ncbi:hypothetical protein [Fimbriiglobus ruber]|uniref:Major capsid protein n=1 Tax=Fimbriiglobus ruber TaxID=1908690 RepID=A0A225E1X6_9BACT|nr:hypothetical protein [Fimbriiglobus ruber]OWK45784.1 hypothetical protein FRUB_02115 [Fimbriiglobus ruber]
MTLRAMGPFNGTLPVPTGMIQGFMRDPWKMPYLRYAQLIPAPEIVFNYWRLDPDEAARMVDLNANAWAYGDYRPTGKGFQIRVEMLDDRTQRWDFPYTLDTNTQRVWERGAGFDPKFLFDRVRAVQAHLHRAMRVVAALQAAPWGGYNSATPQQLLGLDDPVYFDDSSGTELTPSGNPNPNFQIIKKTLNAVKRRITLQTNGAVTGEELVWVLPPEDAQIVAQSGEIVNAVKQSQFARDYVVNPNIEDWGLPDRYAGWKIVVEDTAKVLVNAQDNGTIANVTQPNQRDFIMPAGTSYFVSRPGGLDGNYGFQNFSTVQCYHFNGEARIEAFSEPKHDLIEGHVVMEDKVIPPLTISGFQLTGYLES